MQLKVGNDAPSHSLAPGARSLDLFGDSPWVSRNHLSILAGSVVANLLALVLPLVILQAYDRILPNNSKASLVILAAVVAASLLLEAVLRTARAHLVSWAGSRLVHNLRCEAVRRLVGARNSEGHEPGTHLERLSAIGALKDHNTGQLVVAMVDLPFAVIFLALIAYIAWPLVFVPLLIVAVLAAVGLPLGRRLRSVAEERNEGEERRHAFVVEVLSGIHTIKSLGMEALMNRRYERLVAAQAGRTHSALRLGARAHELGAATSQLTIVAVVAAGAIMIMEGVLTVGALVACSLLAGRALHPLLQGLGSWSHFQSLRVTAERAAETIAVPEEVSGSRLKRLRLRGSLATKKVSFAHPGSATPLFDRVDLSIGAGEIVVISGEGGVGKSTLLRLIGGILVPTSGTILYDGVPATEVDARLLRSQIGFVPQQAVLFRGTILENLAGFREGPAVEAALAIGAALGLDEKVALLPEGLDTRVGEIPSESLPPGIRQQIAIVRAFATKPALVLLDDAFANFDSAEEMRFRDFLISLQQRTTVVFATNHSVLSQIADRHLRIENRRVVECAACAGTATSVAPPADMVGAP